MTLRIASYRIHQSLCGKESLSIEDYWPIGNDKRDTGPMVADPEMVAKIKRIHNLK